MSALVSFLKSVWKALEKCFIKLSRDHRKILAVANKIIENTKNFVDSPAADIITELIPSEIDDNLKMILRYWLPKLLLALTYLSQDDFENEDQAVRAALKRINNNIPEARIILRHGIASALTNKGSNDEITWSGSLVAQEYYHIREAV